MTDPTPLQGIRDELAARMEPASGKTWPPLTLSPRLYDKLTQRRPMPLGANIHRGK